MSYFWNLEHQNPQDLYGHQIESLSGGFLSIQSTTNSNAEAISLPFIWGRSASFNRRQWWIDPDENFTNTFGQQPDDVYWWQLRSLASSSNNTNGGINLTSVNHQEVSSEDDIFLVLAQNDILDPFINTANPIRFRSENPLTDETIFNRLFTQDYQVVEVTEISFEETETNSPVTSVPEPSSYVGVLVLGILGVGLALKRQLGTMRSRSSSV
ncbi:PEP-CTERM sorting domain-containing protein [Oscillatoria sp. HE19RPO]|uniref:PEP-CTERM sorting domain-containing protein n=1 Tax=Oscillatoria sp. HE19RPO TaxID=2954806 RepID=UPI0020C5800E|nr:PEP-CTERM sorting domain-containing protein [Oscillatoria sp. HE19RPO]